MKLLTMANSYILQFCFKCHVSKSWKQIYFNVLIVVTAWAAAVAYY